MDVEHRRLSRTFKCDVESRFDQHCAILSLAQSRMRGGNNARRASAGVVSENLMFPRQCKRCAESSCSGRRRTRPLPRRPRGRRNTEQTNGLSSVAPARWVSPTQCAVATQLSKTSWIQRSRCGQGSISSLALRSRWPLLSRRPSIIRCSLKWLSVGAGHEVFYRRNVMRSRSNSHSHT